MWAERIEQPGAGHEWDYERALSRALGDARTDAATLLSQLRTERAPHFFPGFVEPLKTVDAIRTARPEAESRLLAQADRIKAGGFDLLGYTNVSFGSPINWHTDPYSGHVAPRRHWSRIPFLDATAIGDHKVIWELNRHQHFLTLGQAYWLSADESYARTFAQHVTEWMNENPPKLGINWASSLEVALRIIAWTWALYYFRHSTALTNELFGRMLAFLDVQANHIESYLSTYFSPNTHLTGEALGLFYIGLLFPALGGAPRWRGLGVQILIEELDRQVWDDGVYFEQASFYQRYTADFYLHFLILARRSAIDLPPSVPERVQRVLDHLMYLQRPDGRTPLIGDDDGGSLAPLGPRQANDFRGTMAIAGMVFERADYLHAAQEIGEEAVWVFGATALDHFQKPHVPPEKQSIAFRDGGYVVMRDGWHREANYLVADCGSHGALAGGHAHADALSFEVAAFGVSMIIDPGTFTYTTQPQWREHFRSTAAHNTIVLNGEGSAIPAGPFSWKHTAHARVRSWITHATFDYFEGEHDGFERLTPPARHRRSVLFVKGVGWVLRDLIHSSGPHDITLHFHCAPGIAVEQAHEARVMLRNEERDAGLLLEFCADAGTLWIEDGWISPIYGQRTRAPVCVVEVPRSGAQEVITFLLPWSGAVQPSVRPLDADGGKLFLVEGQGAPHTFVIGDGAVASGSGVETDARLAWISQSQDGYPTQFAIIGGSFLRLGQHVVVSKADYMEYVVGTHQDDGTWHTTAHPSAKQ